jgi:type II secretory pathway pseudopilin PulG
MSPRAAVTIRTTPPSGQRGALMVALMAGIAIMMILAAVAAQNWADVVRRDNEAEMIFRAEDLVRALKRYQKDKGKLPNELKELAEPGQKGQYFVRKLWKDPLVKGGKWQLLYAAPGGGLFDPTAPGVEAPLEGGQESPGMGRPSPVAGQGSPGGNADAPVGIPDIIRHDDGSSEVSGLPIAGVKTKCTDRPFRHYRDKTEYNQWVFSVFDATPQVGVAPGQGTAQAPGLGATPAPNPGLPKLSGPGDGGTKATFPPR